LTPLFSFSFYKRLVTSLFSIVIFFFSSKNQTSKSLALEDLIGKQFSKNLSQNVGLRIVAITKDLQ
jgi:hypothetical protein